MGRAEGNRSTEQSRAKYPVSRSEKAALNVTPEKSSNAASTTTISEAVLVLKVCDQPFKDDLSAVSEDMTLDATATSSTRPVRMPPI